MFYKSVILKYSIRGGKQIAMKHILLCISIFFLRLWSESLKQVYKMVFYALLTLLIMDAEGGKAIYFLYFKHKALSKEDFQPSFWSHHRILFRSSILHVPIFSFFAVSAIPNLSRFKDRRYCRFIQIKLMFISLTVIKEACGTDSREVVQWQCILSIPYSVTKLMYLCLWDNYMMKVLLVNSH